MVQATSGDRGVLRAVSTSEDWLHAFVEKKVLEQHILKTAQKERGRFRTFLLNALKDGQIDLSQNQLPYWRGLVTQGRELAGRRAPQRKPGHSPSPRHQPRTEAGAAASRAPVSRFRVRRDGSVEQAYDLNGLLQGRLHTHLRNPPKAACLPLFTRPAWFLAGPFFSVSVSFPRCPSGRRPAGIAPTGLKGAAWRPVGESLKPAPTGVKSRPAALGKSLAYEPA